MEANYIQVARSGTQEGSLTSLRNQDHSGMAMNPSLDSSWGGWRDPFKESGTDFYSQSPDAVPASSSPYYRRGSEI